MFFFFFKQKTAYEMRISDWSSDVCSSDLGRFQFGAAVLLHELVALGLLFGFGLREREVEAWRHSAEEHFHALGEDDALGEFPRQIGRASCRERVCQYV